MQTQFRTWLNYPDPFKPTGIEFDIPEDAVVTIKIFGSTGEEVLTVINSERLASGNHKVSVNLEGYPKDNYTYRIIAVGKKQSYTEAKRIM